MRRRALLLIVLAVALARPSAYLAQPALFDVPTYGCRGDGKALDTAAINRAVDAASAAGGGVVHFPAGRYLTFSIRLRSHIGLQFAPGAVLVAGDPASDGGRYDAPEPNDSDLYQDFGHSHWQNSLIWGIDVEDVSIIGPGLIDGRGLTRRGPGARGRSGRASAEHGRCRRRAQAIRKPASASMDGQGTRPSRSRTAANVTLRDFSILNGGHFALLATGVDTLTIDNLQVDTNRDGFDIDACRNVRISNVTVNSAERRRDRVEELVCARRGAAIENVTITNCQVSGFDVGTLLDGTFKHTQELAPDRDGVTGRIKLGTESNGGFRNITISNCTFDWSRGLALETVDGGVTRGRHRHELDDAARHDGTDLPAHRSSRPRPGRHAARDAAARDHQQRHRVRCRERDLLPAWPGSTGTRSRT